MPVSWALSMFDSRSRRSHLLALLQRCDDAELLHQHTGPSLSIASTASNSHMPLQVDKHMCP